MVLRRRVQGKEESMSSRLRCDVGRGGVRGGGDERSQRSGRTGTRTKREALKEEWSQ